MTARAARPADQLLRAPRTTSWPPATPHLRRPRHAGRAWPEIARYADGVGPVQGRDDPPRPRPARSAPHAGDRRRPRRRARGARLDVPSRRTRSCPPTSGAAPTRPTRATCPARSGRSWSRHGRLLHRQPRHRGRHRRLTAGRRRSSPPGARLHIWFHSQPRSAGPTASPAVGPASFIWGSRSAPSPRKTASAAGSSSSSDFDRSDLCPYLAEPTSTRSCRSCRRAVEARHLSNSAGRGRPLAPAAL